MDYRVLGVALILTLSLVAPVFAQGITDTSIEESMSPLISLVGGLSRITWTLTQMFIGMDDASIAYFTHQLGFRSNEVTMTVDTNDGGTSDVADEICGIGSFKVDEISGNLNCTNEDGENVYVVADSEKLNVSLLNDGNEDGELDLTDAFDYLIDNDLGKLTIANEAQAQVMIFAIVLPLGMFVFLLHSFFQSTKILRPPTDWVMSGAIALIAARTGVYTGLLSMVSNIFGGGGFFMSMFSIYLLIAILFWFYGGVLGSKKYAEDFAKAKSDVLDGLNMADQANINKGNMLRNEAKSKVNK